MSQPVCEYCGEEGSARFEGFSVCADCDQKLRATEYQSGRHERRQPLRLRWYSCHGCGWEALVNHARNQCDTRGCIGALHIHSDADGEQPKRLLKHSGSCGNQNAIHPAGAYTDVEICGCTGH